MLFFLQLWQLNVVLCCIGLYYKITKIVSDEWWLYILIFRLNLMSNVVYALIHEECMQQPIIIINNFYVQLIDYTFLKYVIKIKCRLQA